MKLPELGYRSPVQNTGRMDPSGPLSAANAQANAVRQSIDVAMSWKQADDDANVAIAVTESESALRKLGATLEHTKVWDTAVMGNVPDGVEYKRDEVDADGNTVLRTKIPMYEIRSQLWDRGVKQYQEKAYSGMNSRDANAKYSKALRSTLAMAADKIATTNIKDHRHELTTKTLVAYDMAVRASDPALASKILEDGARNKLLTPDQVATRAASLVGDVVFFGALITIEKGSNTDLDNLAEQVLSKNTPLLPEQRFKLIDEINKKKEFNRVTFEREREETSASLVADASVNVRLGDITALQAQDLLSDPRILPQHRRQLADTILISGATGVAVSNPDLVSEVTATIASIELMPDATWGERYASQVRITLAQGVRTRQISGANARVLLDQLGDALESPFKTEEYKTTRSQISMQILRSPAPEDFLAMLTGGAAKDPTAYDRFTDAENELRSAVKSGGPGFNSGNWWKANRNRFDRIDWEVGRVATIIGYEPAVTKDGALDFNATLEAYSVANKADQFYVENRRALMRFKRRYVSGSGAATPAMPKVGNE